MKSSFHILLKSALSIFKLLNSIKVMQEEQISQKIKQILSNNICTKYFAKVRLQYLKGVPFARLLRCWEGMARILQYLNEQLKCCDDYWLNIVSSTDGPKTSPQMP